MSVTITGTNADLIEIAGDISEGFTVWDTHDPDRLLAFSDGTVLRIQYTSEEVWRITPEHRTSTSGDLTITQAVPGDEANYTDRAVIDGPVTWVVLGSEIAVPGSTVGPELQEALGEGLTLTAHATGVVTRPDGTVRGG